MCGSLSSTVVDQVKQVLRSVCRSQLATPPSCGFGGGPVWELHCFVNFLTTSNSW